MKQRNAILQHHADLRATVKSFFSKIHASFADDAALFAAVYGLLHHLKMAPADITLQT